LTTRTAQNENESLSTICPKISNALKAAGHLPGPSQLPKLGRILDDREEEMIAAQIRKEEWQKDRRNTYVIIKWSGNWRRPIHKTIDQLKKKYSMGWLRHRMVYKRHSNLKELLLGQLQQKCMEGVVIASDLKKRGDEKCRCQAKYKPDGRCPYGEECETRAVIYKITCRCCKDYYLGKTQNSLKERCQEHYHDVGIFWKKKKAFMAKTGMALIEDMEAPDPSDLESEADESIASRTSARRRTRTQPPVETPAQTPTNPPTNTPGATPNSQFSSSGIDQILALFSPALRATQPTIPEEDSEEDTAVSLGFTADEANDPTSEPSTTQLPTRLTYAHPNQTTNQSTNPQSDDSTIATSDSRSSTFNDAFAEAFGGQAALHQLKERERARGELLRPHLQSEYDSVKCSNLSRHMWSHAKDMNFSSKSEMYQWIMRNWQIEIVYKGSIISAMKTAGTKNCSLCMKERVKIFHAMRKKKTLSQNLMNSRSEMYGSCSCKTRFLRLKAVGSGGADEVSQ